MKRQSRNTKPEPVQKSADNGDAPIGMENQRSTMQPHYEHEGAEQKTDRKSAITAVPSRLLPSSKQTTGMLCAMGRNWLECSGWLLAPLALLWTRS